MRRHGAECLHSVSFDQITLRSGTIVSYTRYRYLAQFASAVLRSIVGAGEAAVPAQAQMPVGAAAVVELHAVDTTVGSCLELRATTAMRIALIRLRSATVGAAQVAPLGSTHAVT